jgi:hypothetical protein
MIYAVPMLIFSLYLQTFKISGHFMLIIACSLTLRILLDSDFYNKKNELLINSF